MTEQEQVDLFSVWLRSLYLRSCGLVVVCAALGGAAGLAYSLARGPTYSMSFMLAIGRIAPVGLIEPAAVTSARLGEWLSGAPEAKDCSWHTSYVPKPESTVTVSLSCPTADLAKSLADRAASTALAPHEKLFADWSDKHRAYAQALEEELASLPKLDGDANGGAETRLTRAWLARELTTAVYEAEVEGPGLRSNPSRLIRESEEPSGPKSLAALRVLLGMAAGLAVGLIAALIRELSRAKDP